MWCWLLLYKWSVCQQDHLSTIPLLSNRWETQSDLHFIIPWHTKSICPSVCLVLVLVWFWRYLTTGFIWHLSQSSIRPSIYFSLILKSRSDPSWNQPVLSNKSKISFCLSICLDSATPPTNEPILMKLYLYEVYNPRMSMKVVNSSQK